MASYIGSTGLTYLWNKIKAVFATKQDTLVSGTNIKTINSQSLLGSGDVSISGAPAIIEMRAVNNSGNLENLSFVDAGEAYDIVVANGDNVVVRIDVGYIENNEPTYYGEYTYMNLCNYYHGESEYYLGFSYSDNLFLRSLSLSNDFEGGTDTLVIQGYDTNGFPGEIEIYENINATTQPFQYSFMNRYDAYYSYIGRNGNVKFVVKRGTRNAQNIFVPNGDTYPLEITYTGETDDKIVCSTYSSEKKLTFVFGIDSTNNQLTIDAINTETIPTESTVSGWGFTKNAGTITGVNVAGVSKGTSGVVDVGISEVNHGTSDTTFTLTPNVMHIWGTVSSLTLSLSTDSNSYLDEYLFTFTSGSTPTTLSLPSTVKWVQDIEVDANKTYQVSIVNNLAGWLTNGMPSGGGGGGGENNVIESISVNSVAQTVDANKNVNLQFKTINNESISGTGNISISGGGNNYIAMTATWDANDEYLENFAFDDASAAYTIYNANGANTVLGIETGIMDGNTFVSDDFYYYAQVDQENGGAQQYFFFEFWDNTDKYKVTIRVNESTLSVNTYSHQEYSIGGGGEANVIESISVNNVAQTVTNKNVNITVPTKVSDLTNDSGFTSNTGTVTGVKMNGASKGTSGVVDLGTVITAHQDISGKADKSEMSVVAGTGANADKTTITLKTGTSATVLTAHQDISGKADSATTLAGYGITNAYTKTESDGQFFGLTNGTELGASSSNAVDLDDITTQGTYYNETSSNAQYISNRPNTSSEIFRLWVYDCGSSSIVQRYRASSSNITYERMYSYSWMGSVWSAWEVSELRGFPRIYSGSSAPSSSTGNNGDIYIQTS